jgi:pimeloyl-ACP methyl ester carboxylesterase
MRTGSAKLVVPIPGARSTIALAAAALFAAANVQAAEQSVTLAGMNVFVWSNDAPHAQAVIVFSHGFHGCATQSRFLMEAFASAGYIVFAPNHRDAVCRGGNARWSDKPATLFQRPESWNAESFRDRADDVRHLIAAIGSDERFRSRADLSRLGLAGHSLGGYTVLGLAGAWPEWKLPGVKAVLALSPYSQPFIVHKTLGGLSAPVMYQGGTWDLGVTPAIQKTSGGYEQSPEPKYFVEFGRAGHFIWTDLNKGFHDEIAAYGIAFMNHYVRGEPAAPALTVAAPDVTALRFASELGRSESRGVGKRGVVR